MPSSLPLLIRQARLLFLEKQDSRGVFILCAGEVKLSISSSAGKTLILRIAKAGEILGLMAALSNSPYEVTAETLRPCQVAFVRRDEFVRFLAKHPEAYLAALNAAWLALQRSLRTIAHCWPVILCSGKTGAVAPRLVTRGEGHQTRVARHAASHPRRDRPIHRNDAGDRHSHVQRIQESTSRRATRFDAHDFQPACSGNYRCRLVRNIKTDKGEGKHDDR